MSSQTDNIRLVDPICEHTSAVVAVVAPAVQIKILLLEKIVLFYKLLEKFAGLDEKAPDASLCFPDRLLNLFTIDDNARDLVLDWRSQQAYSDLAPRCLGCTKALESDDEQYAMMLMRFDNSCVTSGLFAHKSCIDKMSRLVAVGVQKYNLVDNVAFFCTWFRMKHLDVATWCSYKPENERPDPEHVGPHLYKVPKCLRICWNCLKVVVDGDRIFYCSGCRFATFCGAECYNNSWNVYHKNECALCKTFSARYAGLELDENRLCDAFECAELNRFRKFRENMSGDLERPMHDRVLEAVLLVWSGYLINYRDR